MRAQWEDAQRTIEGRPDTEQQSVSLVTMHSSKGLEWPVVIPINMSGDVQNRVKAAVDAGGQLHFPIFGMRGPGGDAALQAERDELDRERHRLWYVAATRARDLLLVPAFSTGIPQGSWMTHVGLKLDDLSPFDLARLPDARLGRDEEPPNTQDRARFETEAALIASRTSKIERITPHLAEAGEDTSTPVVPLSPFSDDRSDVPAPPRGSLARGLVLHKLLEEILTGETIDDTEALTLRAAALAAQLDGVPGAAAFDPAEAAEAVRRGLTLPAIQNLRHALVPEFWIADSVMADAIERITLGVADAVELDADGRVRTVVDWKSDVAPTATTIAHYRAQVRAYLAASGASRGLIVYLSSGAVDEVV
jgi:exodeoxyribonuclease-5